MCFELTPISRVKEMGGSSKPRDNAAFSLCDVVAAVVRLSIPCLEAGIFASAMVPKTFEHRDKP